MSAAETFTHEEPLAKKPKLTSPENDAMDVDISIILPVYNAQKWLDDCLASILSQEQEALALELSVYNDCSSDDSLDILKTWQTRFNEKKIQVIIGSHFSGGPKGVGYAKNRAVEQCHGQYLCFQDADDQMQALRILKQHQAAKVRPFTIIGSQFHREPENSTERYTNWANRLNMHQLHTQVYTSHGPTVIMPTWFMSRETYDRVGQFDESGKGTPEDLIFFYKHLAKGGKIHRVDEDLLMYRYHPEAETFSVKEETIWDLRVEAIQKHVLSKWEHFSIWNAGKQGRHLYRSLQPENQNKVTSFCDVDEKKIRKGFYTYEESKQRPKPKVPIFHFTKAKPPFIICVKQDLTGGGFEKNLASLNLTEGVDYFHFN